MKTGKNLCCLLCISTILLTVNAQAKWKNPHEIKLDLLDDDNDQKLLIRNRNDNLDAIRYYRRIVKYLFHKKRFIEADPGKSNYYIANIQLKVDKRQYDMLVSSDINGLNLHEIDSLLDDVLKQSTDIENWPVSSILIDYYKRQFLESISAIIFPAALTILAIAAIVLMKRVLHFSKLTFSAIIIIIVLVICAISYAMTYFDCMTDLEVDQMIQLSKEKSLNNPCTNYHGEHDSVWKAFKATAFGSSENKCYEHMRKTFKPSKKFCDPLAVFAHWTGKIQMSYIASVLKEFLTLVSSLTGSSGIVSKALFWIGAVSVFICILISFGKVAIKFVINGIFDILKTSPEQKNEVKEDKKELLVLMHKMDRILLENEDMKRELSYIRECSEERSLPKDPLPNAIPLALLKNKE